MTISIEQVKKWAKPHTTGGKQTRIKSNGFLISIVGGAKGLYGDFEETFELAVLDKKNNFVTQYFKSVGDDIMSYISPSEVEEVLDLVIGESNFQVL